MRVCWKVVRGAATDTRGRVSKVPLHGIATAVCCQLPGGALQKGTQHAAPQATAAARSTQRQAAARSVGAAHQAVAVVPRERRSLQEAERDEADGSEDRVEPQPDTPGAKKRGWGENTVASSSSKAACSSLGKKMHAVALPHAALKHGPSINKSDSGRM